MMYEGINNAINNVNRHQIEMANVFNVSKWNQFRQMYLPITLPYIFSAMVMAFGLTFKVTVASQFVQTVVLTKDPAYSSIGIMIRSAMHDGQFDVLIA
jgi:ABC-type nitrate/sulfonate/bicarbonate transport system permease component